MKMGVGFQAFLLYVGLYYLIPIVFGLFYQFNYLNFLDGEPNYYFAVVYICLYFFVCIFIYILIPDIKFPAKKNKLLFFNLSYVFFFISFFYVILAYKFFNDYGFQYRHKGVSVSESAGYVKILLLVRMLITAYLIYLLSRMSFSKKLLMVDITNLLFILLGTFFSLATSFDVVVIVFIIFLLIYHFFSINLIFKKGKASFFKRICSILFVFFVGSVVLFVGVANKIGVDSAVAYIFDGGGKKIVELFLQRISIFFYSTAYLIEYNLFDAGLQLDALEGNVKNLQYRIDILLGSEAYRPELASTARINSELIYIDPKERNGAAPGMIASSIFVPFFPLNLFVSSLYVVATIKIIDSLFADSIKLKFIPCFFIMISLQVLVDTQPDIVNVLSFTFIQYMLLLFLWCNRVKA